MNIEWAGVLVELTSNLKLNDFFKQNILQPLGIFSTSLFPDQGMKERLVKMHQRQVDGSLEERPHLFQTGLTTAEADQATVWHNGGGGGYGTATDYCGTSSRLLSPMARLGATH